MRDEAGSSGGAAGQAAGSDPLCFVLMPFGRKSDAAGATIDFNAVYQQLIAPAIRAAGLEPVRADDDMTGGIVHKPMFERLILCEYAVADLTFANANVFYELGVRHAVRPYSTVLVFAAGTRLPFDVALDRGLPYSLSPAGGPTDVGATRARLADRLVAARDASVDSPVFQLIEGFPDISRLKNRCVPGPSAVLGRMEGTAGPGPRGRTGGRPAVRTGARGPARRGGWHPDRSVLVVPRGKRV